jgi:hypothetical protein
VEIEIASSTPSSYGRGRTLDGNPSAGREAGRSHEGFPLRSVRPAPLAVELIDGDVCKLVTKSFF